MSLNKLIAFLTFTLTIRTDDAYVAHAVERGIREHFNSLRTDKLVLLAAHCTACGCKRFLDRATIRFKHYDQRTRETAEALYIAKARDSLISSPSESLTHREEEEEYTLLKP